MDVDWIRPLLGRDGPWTSVHLPVARGGARDALDVWRPLRRSLESQGAPPALLETLEDVVRRPVRSADASGRILVATDEDGLLVDRLLPDAPVTPRAVRGPVPDLVQAAIYSDGCVDHVVVTVDRHGADVVRHGWGASDVEWHATVEGERDDVAQVRTGGVAGPRAERRVQDAWESNAAEVAHMIDALVATDGPAVVVLTGDLRAVGLVTRALGPRARALVAEVPGGSRTGGVDDAALAERVRGVLEAHRAKRRCATVARLTEQLVRGREAVTSLADVVAALHDGQVAELVLEAHVPGAAADGEVLWTGGDPTAVSLSPDVLVQDGEVRLREMPVVDALLRAAIGQRSAVTLVEAGVAPLVDGVAAFLRWPRRTPPAADGARGGSSTVSARA